MAHENEWRFRAGSYGRIQDRFRRLDAFCALIGGRAHTDGGLSFHGGT